MFELKISGNTLEEFQSNLKLACINFLQEEKTNVHLNQGPKDVKNVETPVTTFKEEKNESKKRQKRRKEEVITSPLSLGEEVNNSPITSDLSEVVIEGEKYDLTGMDPEEAEDFKKGRIEVAEMLRKANEVDTTDYSKIEIVPIEQLKASPKQILQQRQSNPTQIDYFTLNEVKDFFMEVFGKAGRETANKILTKYGVDKVSLLSEDNRQRVAVDCLEYLAALDANSSR